MNAKQIMAILIVILSVLAISGTNLADLFGPKLAKTISSAANILNGIMGGILGVITGQAAMVKEVAAMPGIEPIRVNAQAGPTLARIAMDQDVDKVSALSKDIDAITETATQ